MNPIKVAVIEDTEPFRKTLQVLLNGTPGLHCPHTYASGEAALRNLPGQPPDIVLVDIQLPGLNGIEVMQQLKQMLPRLQFLVLTVYEDDDNIFYALATGASGYLLKSATPAKIIEAIKELYDGGSPMSPRIARKVVASFQQAAPHQANPYQQVLTQREKEVLALLSKGLLYKQIADELHISVETVKSHCHNIYEKLHVTTRTEAVNKFFMR